jgi:hypothetical protein
MLNNNYILVSKFNNQKTVNYDISKLNSLYKKNIPKHNFGVKFENIILKKKENEGFNNTMDDINIINTIITNNHAKNDVNINKNININNINNIKNNNNINNIKNNNNNNNINNNNNNDNNENNNNINNNNDNNNNNNNNKLIFNNGNFYGNLYKNNHDDTNNNYTKLLNIKNSIIYINNLQKNIKIINNVYQETYAKNVKASGLGDFMRGCYFLLQFCEKYNFQTNILINHPISMFLKKFYNTFNLNTNLFNLVSSYPDNNWNNSTLDSSNYIISYNKDNDLINCFIHYLHTVNTSNESSNENLYIYNIFYPYNNVCDNHRIYMREIFEPNEEMITYINKVLNSIGYNKYEYSVIHIRSGDKYLNNSNTQFYPVYLKKIINEILILIQSNMNTNFLLISDNNQIKRFIIKFFPRLRTIFKDISHLGEGTVLEKEKVKNTMLDFYLLSYSNSINSYTCHLHGSGFSRWCAETYNIPYKCKFIQN